jgi:hypothetical protein
VQGIEPWTSGLDARCSHQERVLCASKRAGAMHTKIARAIAPSIRLAMTGCKKIVDQGGGKCHAAFPDPLGHFNHGLEWL